LANERVTLLRSAKIPELGWRRGQAVMGKTGKVKPDFMFLGRDKKKKEVHAPEGYYVLIQNDRSSDTTFSYRSRRNKIVLEYGSA